ncbi:MAG: LPS assembly lipoprotein LptE [Oceanipulchritudo sp.]
MRKIPAPLLPLALVLSLMAGCAQYEPVPRVADEPVRLAVLPVINESGIPQITAPLARNVRERIAHSPNWRLTGAGDAEATLQLRVVGMERRELARDPEDTGRPLSYRKVIRLSLEWRSDLSPPWGGDPVALVETSQLLYSQPSLVDAERAAIAEMADRLAEKVIQQLDWFREAQ